MRCTFARTILINLVLGLGHFRRFFFFYKKKKKKKLRPVTDNDIQPTMLSQLWAATADGIHGIQRVMSSNIVIVTASIILYSAMVGWKYYRLRHKKGLDRIIACICASSTICGLFLRLDIQSIIFRIWL